MGAPHAPGPRIRGIFWNRHHFLVPPFFMSLPLRAVVAAWPDDGLRRPSQATVCSCDGGECVCSAPSHPTRRPPSLPRPRPVPWPDVLNPRAFPTSPYWAAVMVALTLYANQGDRVTNSNIQLRVICVDCHRSNFRLSYLLELDIDILMHV